MHQDSQRPFSVRAALKCQLIMAANSQPTNRLPHQLPSEEASNLGSGAEIYAQLGQLPLGRTNSPKHYPLAEPVIA